MFYFFFLVKYFAYRMDGISFALYCQDYNTECFSTSSVMDAMFFLSECFFPDFMSFYILILLEFSLSYSLLFTCLLCRSSNVWHLAFNPIYLMHVINIHQVKIVHICEATLMKRLIEFENTDSGSLTVCLLQYAFHKA